MSNEITVTTSLYIRKTNSTGQRSLIEYRSGPSSFRADLDTDAPKGPVPGALAVPTTGIDVDLSQLTTPGMCWLHHMGLAAGTDLTMTYDQYPVEYGIKEPATGFFYPLGELLPGESYVIRLSRNLEEEYTDTGTGTSTPTNTLHLKATGGTCVVRVDAFER